jgi:hypothetical protein
MAYLGMLKPVYGVICSIHVKNKTYYAIVDVLFFDLVSCSREQATAR